MEDDCFPKIIPAKNFLGVIASFLHISSIWTSNPGFTGSDTGWTLDTSSGGGSSYELSVYNSVGHGASDGCPDFSIISNSGGSPYYYSENDKAYAEQTRVE